MLRYVGAILQHANSVIRSLFTLIFAVENHLTPPRKGALHSANSAVENARNRIEKFDFNVVDIGVEVYHPNGSRMRVGDETILPTNIDSIRPYIILTASSKQPGRFRFKLLNAQGHDVTSYEEKDSIKISNRLFIAPEQPHYLNDNEVLQNQMWIIEASIDGTVFAQLPIRWEDTSRNSYKSRLISVKLKDELPVNGDDDSYTFGELLQHEEDE